MKHERCLRAVLTGIALTAGSSALACTVSSTTLSFGVIDPLRDGQRDSTADISVSCPTTTVYSIALSPGSGTYAQRTLLSGVLVVNYNLYTDSQRTQIWGDGNGTTWTVSGLADSTGAAHTIFGSIPSQPAAVPGIYSDTVVITVTY